MIGIDLVEVQRMQQFVETKSAERLFRIFTEEEIKYAQSSRNIYQRYAVRFAVKEAFFKVFQYGVFREIELGKNPSQINLYGTTLQRWRESGSPQISVSVSHTEHYAIAVLSLKE
ncbi:MAG: holo-ACP synthase [Brevinema sp.]